VHAAVHYFHALLRISALRALRALILRLPRWRDIAHHSQYHHERQ
jgi:hypothetical protein